VDVFFRAIVGWSAATSKRAKLVLDAGVDASVGTVGDALDNMLMESQIGLYKTELIKPRKSWRGLADVELATAE
jgi:putative transposase